MDEGDIRCSEIHADPELNFGPRRPWRAERDPQCARASTVESAANLTPSIWVRKFCRAGCGSRPFEDLMPRRPTAVPSRMAMRSSRAEARGRQDMVDRPGGGNLNQIEFLGSRGEDVPFWRGIRCPPMDTRAPT